MKLIYSLCVFQISYRYVNYYVRLEEGDPPAEYYKDLTKINPKESLEKYLADHRKKHVPYHQEQDPSYH